MKKFLLLLCLSILSFTCIKSQNWSVTLTPADGLPGEANAYSGQLYYTFNSKVFTPGGTLDIIRLTVVETVSNEAPNENNVIFALSDLKVYDGNGNEVGYTASSNADHNSLCYPDTDGEGLEALNDTSIKSYFHSMWGKPAVTDYHYIDLVLTRTVSSFSLEWSTRLNVDKNSPTVVGITLGTEYVPSESSADFSLGDAVSEEKELAADGQFFVLKGNAVKTFTSPINNNTYTGNGPIYMQCAENGDIKANHKHVMQLIPYGNGEYIIYWPFAGKFLKNSGEDYDEVNGWQYSTYNFEDAAHVKVYPTGDGYFEMKYDTEYNGKPLTLYVGAEMREGASSKMKTFDLEHKQYLEAGDYTKGFSLPIAFKWSIYKANIESSEVNALDITQIAGQLLNGTLTKAMTYSGSYDKYCKNSEDVILNNKINDVYTLLESSNVTFEEIYRKKEELLAALSNYIATKLAYYSEQVNGIYSTAEYSTYPYYVKGTYPETSKSIIEGLMTTISNAQGQQYSVEQYEALYSQIERDIELFENTKIEETTIPDDKNEEGKEDVINEDILFVYLSNGDIDAYALSIMDGEHYIENGKLYIPMQDGEVFYYSNEEYDSCSMVKPELPTMQTFKFNNKYNPNLHTDAIAETVTDEMNFRLNSIGKWLTASFTLSDDKAVAYVDTVLQVSKETRQSFKTPVTYHVTYPGYNIIKNVKVQDEIWTTPVTGTIATDVALTKDMLYTNKPSIYADEGLENLLDNNPNTIFHSTNGKANDNTLNVNTYITIDLPESLEKIQIYYKCRPSSGYNPKIWDIYASNDGNSWKLVRTLDYVTDNMPTGGSGQEFTSSIIDLGGSYSKLKILQINGEYHKNHFVLSELRIKKITEATGGEPEKIQDAKYETKRIPYGNSYKVKVDWLTDTPGAVPRIDIDVDGGFFVTSKDYYLNAKFRITGYGVYDNFEDSVQIKGRGNTSWGYDKKPYRLKFAEKVKPFGLTKGKSWVLLANAQKGSLMANAIAMKIGQMTKAEYTNHIIPVELYMNGEYMGSYMFTEKVGLANNSVDVDEDNGYLLELDEYYDETYKFKDDRFQLPINIKEPDLTEYTQSIATNRFNKIKKQMNDFCEAVYMYEDIEGMLDLDAFARFMLANDLTLNQEIGHPKSTFLFKEDENDNNAKFKFGPIWDFDWAFGYEDGGHKYCYSESNASVIKTNFNAYSFFTRLMQYYTSFKKQYYKVWEEFIKNKSMDELLDFIDSYYTFAQSSFNKNTSVWGNSYGFTDSDKERHKSWIEQRKNYLYNNLEKYNIDDLIYIIVGDVNCNNQVTIHDAALITAYLNGKTHKSFSESKGDCDKNGSIDLDDARMVEELVHEGDAPSSAYWYSSAQAIGEFYSDDVVIEVGDVQSAVLNLLSYDEEQYKAMQFDITIPQGLSLIDIINSDAVYGHNFAFVKKGENTYRITAYSDKDECITNGEALVEFILRSDNIINEKNCIINISNAYVVDNENNELRLNDHKIVFSQATGISDIEAELLVEGGEHISVTVLEPQVIEVYSVDGRKVRTINARKGTTNIAIPAGVYVVNGEKVIVR